MSKVLVALSGGVDSSVAALLLKQQGHDVIGITLNIYSSENYRFCSMAQNIKDAIILANHLCIPHYVIDVRDEFKKLIINDFIHSYESGVTPNPCVHCNYLIKWKTLIRVANEFSCDFVATGHYAKLKNQGNNILISMPKDQKKDQTCFLWRLSQEQLQRTIFPLGDYDKKEVKQIAVANHFTGIAQKRESYNICFIPDGNYRSFISSRLNREGNHAHGGILINENGGLIGEHQGIWAYTVGQKVICSDFGEPLYVLEIVPGEKKIILGKREQLSKTIAILEPYKLSRGLNLTGTTNLRAGYSYKSPFECCKIAVKDNQLILKFDNPVPALAPGQSIAIYCENDLIGGGIIKKSL